MTSPFNVPDEFVKGFIKSGLSLWQAMLPGSATQPSLSGTPTTPEQAVAPSDPGRLAELQLSYFQQQLTLWTRMVAGAAGQPVEPVVSPERGDRRFSGAEWHDEPVYSLLKQSYIQNARLIGELAEAAELDEATKHRLRFYARQFFEKEGAPNGEIPDVGKLDRAGRSRGERHRQTLSGRA